MNILAEKQKRLFEEGLDVDEYDVREKDFLELYYRAEHAMSKAF